MQCLMCPKELTLSHEQTRTPSAGDDVMDGGTVEITLGYGSRYDCRAALAYICDDCFEANRHKYVAQYDGSARPGEKDWVPGMRPGHPL